MSSKPEPLAAAPHTLEPWAQQADAIDRSLSSRQSVSVRSPLIYVGLATALVLMLGSIALLTRSSDDTEEDREPASKPQPAVVLDLDMSRDDSAKPGADTREGDTREAAAPKTGASEPDAAESDTAESDTAESDAVEEPGNLDPAPGADAERDAPVAVASPGGSVTVTIRASPTGAIIYDEKQRIGKGVARINLKPGRKRSMLALLNLHHPRHFVVDGTETEVNITLEPMDANAIARAIAGQKRKAVQKRKAAQKR